MTSDKRNSTSRRAGRFVAVVTSAVAFTMVMVRWLGLTPHGKSGPLTEVLAWFSTQSQSGYALLLVLTATVLLQAITSLDAYWGILRPGPAISSRLRGRTLGQFVTLDARKYLHTIYAGTMLGIIIVICAFWVCNTVVSRPVLSRNDQAIRLIRETADLADGFRLHEAGALLQDVHRKDQAASQLERLDQFWIPNHEELDGDIRARLCLAAVQLAIMDKDSGSASDWLARMTPVPAKYLIWHQRLSGMVREMTRPEPATAERPKNADPRIDDVRQAESLIAEKRFEEAAALMRKYVAFFGPDPSAKEEVHSAHWLVLAYGIMASAERQRDHRSGKTVAEAAAAGVELTDYWLCRPDLRLLDRIAFEKSQVHLYSELADNAACDRAWGQSVAYRKACIGVLETLRFERKVEGLVAELEKNEHALAIAKSQLKRQRQEAESSLWLGNLIL